MAISSLLAILMATFLAKRNAGYKPDERDIVITNGHDDANLKIMEIQKELLKVHAADAADIPEEQE